MEALAIRFLVAVGIAAAVAFTSYRLGATHTDNAWQAKERAREQAEASAREAEIRRGEKASGALQAELLTLRTRDEELMEAFNEYARKRPLIVPAPQPAGAPGCAAAAASEPAAPLRGVSVPDRAQPALTAGAVWLWNSALHGRDWPEGACGSADPASPACDAAAGVSLEDAWRNQAVNARLCAEDRLRHQRLIDYIQNQPKTQGALP